MAPDNEGGGAEADEGEEVDEGLESVLVDDGQALEDHLLERAEGREGD